MEGKEEGETALCGEKSQFIVNILTVVAGGLVGWWGWLVDGGLNAGWQEYGGRKSANTKKLGSHPVAEMLKQGKTGAQPLGGRFSAGIGNAFISAQLFDHAFQQFALFDFKNAGGRPLLATVKSVFQFRFEFFRVCDVPSGQNSFGVLRNAHENLITSADLSRIFLVFRVNMQRVGKKNCHPSTNN